MPTLRINGSEKEFPEALPASVAELLTQLGIQETTVVAEVDGRVIAQADFARTRLQPG